MWESRGRAIVQASIAALLLAGCRREEITHYQAAKAVDPASASVAADPPQPTRPTGGLRWTLPKGWTEAVAGGMRYATLKPPLAGVEVSVVVLPGSAGGEVANVNRWRGQLGLSPIDEAALARSRETIRTRAGPFALYDFTGEGEKKSRMIAALAVLDGNTWFLKLLGGAPSVAAARRDFIHLLEGLRVEPAN